MVYPTLLQILLSIYQQENNTCSLQIIRDHDPNLNDSSHLLEFVVEFMREKTIALFSVDLTDETRGKLFTSPIPWGLASPNILRLP